MSFGYCVGDIVLGITIVNRAISALKETGGSSTEYQAVVRELSDLLQVLKYLESTHRAGSRHADVNLLNAVAAHAQKSAEDVQSFLESISKYESLRCGRQWYQKIPRKLQWNFADSKKINDFRCKLNAHLSLIQTLQDCQQVDLLHTTHDTILIRHAKAQTALDSIKEKLDLSLRNEERIQGTVDAILAHIRHLPMEPRLQKVLRNPANMEGQPQLSRFSSADERLPDGSALAIGETMQSTIKRAESRLSVQLTKQSNTSRDYQQQSSSFTHRNIDILRSQNHQQIISGFMLEYPQSYNTLTARNRSSNKTWTLGENADSQLHRAENNQSRLAQRFSDSDITLTGICDYSPSFTVANVLEIDVLRQCFHLLNSLAYAIRRFLWKLLSRHPQVLLLIYALTTRVPAVPSITLTFNDSIYLIDAFGQRGTLQYATHRHFTVFVSFLIEEYKNTPSGRYIVRNQYRLVNAKAPRIQTITKKSWSDTIKPGFTIILSMYLARLEKPGMCPRCGTVSRSWSPTGDWQKCSCGLTVLMHNDLVLPEQSFRQPERALESLQSSQHDQNSPREGSARKGALSTPEFNAPKFNGPATYSTPEPQTVKSLEDSVEHNISDFRCFKNISLGRIPYSIPTGQPTNTGSENNQADPVSPRIPFTPSDRSKDDRLTLLTKLAIKAQRSLIKPIDCQEIDYRERVRERRGAICEGRDPPGYIIASTV